MTDIDLTQLYDETKSLAEGAITVPGYTADGWATRIFIAAGLDADKKIRDYSAKELDLFLRQEPIKVKVENINLTYEGLDPQGPEVDAVQGPRGDAAPHPGVRRPGGHLHRVPRLRRHATQRRALGRRRSAGSTSPMPARCRSATWRSGSGTSTSRRWPRCSATCGTPSTRSSRSGSATSRSTGPRARCPAARRSGPR